MTRVPAAILAAAALAACQPRALPGDATTCLPEQPEPGTVVVAEVRCAEMSIPGGVGRVGDVWLANHRIRAVLRHPQASFTLAGVGGGTLVDGSPWGQSDSLQEIAPLVGGGWLSVETMELLADGVRLEGTIVSLPDRPAEAAGDRAEVVWRLDPDDSWLRFEGAEGLWIHTRGGWVPRDGWMWEDRVVVGHDGRLQSDLGGAMRIEGATAVFLGSPAEAMDSLAGADGIEVSGVAPDADRVAVLRDGQAIGWIPVDAEGAFEATVPADTTTLRAEGAGRPHSDAQPPSLNQTLEVGQPATVEFRPAWGDSPGHSMRVDWWALDGRSGAFALPVEGGTVSLGEGSYTAVVSAGPAYASQPIAFDAEVDRANTVVTELEELIPLHDHALVVIGWPSERSRTYRGLDSGSANTAVSLGADWVVFADEDDVASVSDNPTSFPRIPHRNGSLSMARNGTWTLASWPWTRADHRPAGGAVDTRGLSAEDALAAALGGVTRDRHTVVDLSWLAQVGAPWTVTPRPELVRLAAPGSAGPTEVWADWFDWLDASIALVPVGPATWVPIPDRLALASEDIEQALAAGATVATSGPRLDLRVGDRGPGEVLDSSPDGVLLVEVELLGGAKLDHVALIGQGGNVLTQWAPLESGGVNTVLISDPGRWLLAAAWSDTTDDFVGTAPIWVDPPGGDQDR